MMGAIIGGAVGWWLASMYCAPTSAGGSMVAPCNEISLTTGPLTYQTVVAVAAGAFIGRAISK